MDEVRNMEELWEIDLTEDFRDNKSAVKRMQYEIATARANGIPVVKIYHGTPGEGDMGKLRKAVRTLLKRYKRENRIRFFLEGENVDDMDAVTGYLMDKYPYVSQQDRQWGSCSQDYVIVCV